MKGPGCPMKEWTIILKQLTNLHPAPGQHQMCTAVNQLMTASMRKYEFILLISSINQSNVPHTV